MEALQLDTSPRESLAFRLSSGLTMVAAMVGMAVAPGPTVPALHPAIAGVVAALVLTILPVHRRGALLVILRQLLLAVPIAVVALAQRDLDELSRTVQVLLAVAAMLASTGVRARGWALWTLTGYAVTALAMHLPRILAGYVVVPRPARDLVLVVLLLAYAAIAFGARTGRHLLGLAEQAAGDEDEELLRRQIEARAAALLHDTLLATLREVGRAPDGPVSAPLREELERAMRLIDDERWLADLELEDDVRPENGSWYAAVAAGERLGLEVTVSGAPSAIERLPAPTTRALALATRQCLENVVRHAGVHRADVVVTMGADGEVVVLVVDAGRGFDTTAVGRARFGIRQSISARLASVGGAVDVWSAPGRGTTVRMRVPIVTGASDALQRAGT